MDDDDVDQSGDELPELDVGANPDSPVSPTKKNKQKDMSE